MGSIIVRKRHPIRKAQINALFERLDAEIGASAALFMTERVERIESTAKLQIFLIDRRPLLMEQENWVFPTLRGAIACPFDERHVVVDSGAIPYLINGADVMRPGIVSVSPDVKRDRPVLIVEERHNKPIAVGISLYDHDDLERLERGKAVRTIHYVGDELWNLEF